MEKDFTKVYSRSSFESLYFYVSSLKVSVSDLRKKNKGKVTPRDLEIEVSVSDLRNKFDGGWLNLITQMGPKLKYIFRDWHYRSNSLSDARTACDR